MKASWFAVFPLLLVRPTLAESETAGFLRCDTHQANTFSLVYAD